MSSINDEALLQEFVAESKEHLSAIEPDLLILEREQTNTDSEIINRIFRAIHSIKGASGFFGLESLKSLSHSMESILMMLRDKQLLPSSDVMDPLLIGVDRLRLMLDDIQASDTVMYQDVVQTLETLMGNPPPEAPASSPEPTASSTPTEQNESSPFNLDPHAIQKAVSNGQKLYDVTIWVDRDLKQKNRTPEQIQELFQSTGLFLDSNLELSKVLSSESPWHVLFASVLEADMVANAFELDETQFKPIALENLLRAEANNTPPPIHSTPIAEATKPMPKAPTNNAKPGGGGSGSESNETIRVKVDHLNRLMDLAGELVLARNQLTRIFQSQLNKTNDMSTIIQNVNLVTSDLQEHIMQTRMQPISSVFGKFPRLVRDLSRQLNKEISLEMSGEEVELDKSILENLSDPLTHLIRNCCDHALETPDIRAGKGKPRQGAILLKAYQESGHINIAVIDDGAGIDHERVARKALDSGIISEAAIRQMSPQEQVNLIFMPGFSTAEAVTDVSGRGVGMDVVRTNIEQIGGSISIETEKDKGTTILLRLPLTLAIIPSLVVSSKDQIFAVPQINLVELVSVSASQIATRIEKVGSASVLRLRGKLLPLIALSDVLDLQKSKTPTAAEASDEIAPALQEDYQFISLNKDHPQENEEKLQDYNILVLKSGDHQYGLIVDEIKDIEEIVVKPLSLFIKNCKCFSGATIMGDGRVAMILDAAGIITTSNLSFSEIHANDQKRRNSGPLETNTGTQQSQSILLFSNAPNEVFAMPLASILRLEKIQMSSIEKIGQQQFLPYQGKSMALIFLHEQLPVTPMEYTLEEAYLIIPNDGNGSVGIIASSILDAMDLVVKLEPSLKNHPGIMGSAVINNHITLFINPQGLLESSGFTMQTKRTEEWQADHLQPSL